MDLALAEAEAAHDRGEVPVQFQLLDCPMLDDRQVTPSSRLDDLMIWTRESNTFGWQSYLGDLYGADNVPPTAAAARAEDLSGLPEAYVCVGGADGLEVDGAVVRLLGHVPDRATSHPGRFGFLDELAHLRGQPVDALGEEAVPPAPDGQRRHPRPAHGLHQPAASAEFEDGMGPPGVFPMGLRVVHDAFEALAFRVRGSMPCRVDACLPIDSVLRPEAARSQRQGQNLNRQTTGHLYCINDQQPRSLSKD